MMVSTIQFSENLPSDSAAFNNAFARPNVKRTAMQNRASCCSRAVHYFPVLLPTSGDAILVPNQLNQPENRRPDNNYRLTRVFQSSPLPFFPSANFRIPRSSSNPDRTCELRGRRDEICGARARNQNAANKTLKDAHLIRKRARVTKGCSFHEEIYQLSTCNFSIDRIK